MCYKTKIKARKMIVLKNRLLKWQFNIKCSLIKERHFLELSKKNKLEMRLRLSKLKSVLRNKNLKKKISLIYLRVYVNKNVQ